MAEIIGRMKLKSNQELIREIEFALKDTWIDHETHHELKREFYRSKNDSHKLNVLLMRIKGEIAERRNTWGSKLQWR